MTMPGALNTAWVNTQIVNASDMNSVASTVNALETLCQPLTNIGPVESPERIVQWDSNENLQANNMQVGLVEIPTTGGVTTLTITSPGIIVFTGNETETCVLASTNVPAGLDTLIVNQSSAAVTVEASGGGTIIVLSGSSSGIAASALFTAVIPTPTLPSGWNCQHLAINIASGKILSVANTLTFQGTDGTTFTFPASSDTVMGLTATQTGTNKTLLNQGGTGNVIAGGQLALTTAFSLSNSTVLTNILTTTIPTGSLPVGATFKAKLFGTVAWGASAGSLTFTAQLGGTASTMTPVFGSQASSALAQVFECEILMTVRSTGSGGTYMAYGAGQVYAATPLMIVPTTATSTAAINTTAATPTLQIAAQWSSAAAGNALVVTNATLERVV